MPRKYRIPLRRRRAVELDKRTIRLLAKGQDFFNDYRRPVTRALDMDRVREVWEQHRDDFMAGWLEHHPGYRPWAFWTFDAPDDRRGDTGTMYAPALDYLAAHGLLYEGEADRAAELGEGANPLRLKIDDRTADELVAGVPRPTFPNGYAD